MFLKLKFVIKKEFVSVGVAVLQNFLAWMNFYKTKHSMCKKRIPASDNFFATSGLFSVSFLSVPPDGGSCWQKFEEHFSM